MACDISKSHLNASYCRENIWFQGGKDTGEDKGKVLIVDRVLCGLRSSGASWSYRLSKTLQEDFSFDATRADLNVYWRPACHNGFECHKSVFVCVDDLLILSKEPMNWIKKLGAIYNLKEDSVSPPDTYLGAQIGKTQLPLGFTAWHMEANKCVKNATEVVQKLLDKDGNRSQIKQAKMPHPTRHKPELDVTEELDDAMISQF